MIDQDIQQIWLRTRRNDDGSITMTMEDIRTAKWMAQQFLYRANHYTTCANTFTANGEDLASAGARREAERCRGVATIIGTACLEVEDDE